MYLEGSVEISILFGLITLVCIYSDFYFKNVNLTILFLFTTLLSFVITFIGIYSDFILAAIFLKDKNLWTVAVGINTVFVDDFNADWGVIAASSVIAATPIAVLFIFFQKILI